jgi:hypothetical protein
MNNTDLNFPVLTGALPPPPPGTLDDYYDFVCLLASMRPAGSRLSDAEAHDGPPFCLDKDGDTTRLTATPRPPVREVAG